MVQTGAKQSVNALVSSAQSPSSNAYEFKDLHMEFKRPGKYRLTYVVDRYSTSVSYGNPVLCAELTLLLLVLLLLLRPTH